MTKSEKEATPDPLVVDIHDLQFQYKGADKPILDIPRWQLQADDRIFLYGKSGSGKSTLLNLLSGTLTPNQGEITLFGEAFSTLSSRKRDKFRAKHIGVVFQQFNLISYLSVEDNIRAAAWFANNTKAHLADKIRHLVAQLQLPESLLTQRAGQLSVGQQQRVAIARALINDPGLLIVDEPTSALDTDARDRFMQLLLTCCDQSKSTLIFVSHDQTLKQFFTKNVSLTDINQAASPTSADKQAQEQSA